ncbi:hypothetical protein [Arthrobacter woluwensis]|nr:hypothetical protein [Arthrobacter woluwensis]
MEWKLRRKMMLRNLLMLRSASREAEYERLFQVAEEHAVTVKSAIQKVQEASAALATFTCGEWTTIVDYDESDPAFEPVEIDVECQLAAGHTGPHHGLPDIDSSTSPGYTRAVERYIASRCERKEAGQARSSAVDQVLALMCQAWDPEGYGNPCTRRREHRGAHRRPEIPYPEVSFP